jgi:hypothetical protein
MTLASLYRPFPVFYSTFFFFVIFRKKGKRYSIGLCQKPSKNRIGWYSVGSVGRVPSVIYSSMKAFRPETNEYRASSSATRVVCRLFWLCIRRNRSRDWLKLWLMTLASLYRPFLVFYSIFDFSSFFEKNGKGYVLGFYQKSSKIDAADIRWNLGRIPFVMYSSTKAFRPETNVLRAS